jgi:hypothetical protein
MKKIRVPTWAKENSVATLRQVYGMKNVAPRIKANNKLARFLRAHGWTFREGVNIVETGYNLCFTKPTGFVDRPKKGQRPHPHPTLHFSWYWENYGDKDFWTGTIYTFYNYNPTTLTRQPYATFEIGAITESDLPKLHEYEQQLIHALASQHPVNS